MDFENEQKWIDKNWLTIRVVYDSFHGYKEVIIIEPQLFTERTGLKVVPAKNSRYNAFDEFLGITTDMSFELVCIEKWFLAKIKYGFN